MNTQRAYADPCAICGRLLIGNGVKRYWPAFRIREVKPRFKGGEVIDPITGIPKERGAYVCRSRAKCFMIKTR